MWKGVERARAEDDGVSFDVKTSRKREQYALSTLWLNRALLGAISAATEPLEARQYRLRMTGPAALHFFYRKIELF